MALYLLLLMLTACAATPQDLSGQMFTFPQETNSAHVRLTTSRTVLSAVTVCFRSFSDLRRDITLFSLSTPSADNDFGIYKLAATDEFEMWIRNTKMDFIGQDYKLNTWHSLCSTWDSGSGLFQMWLDGQPSSRRFMSAGSSISGPIIIVLGQDQDSHGGGFDIAQSFVGMMSDVHMWDHVLSPCEIQNYVHHLHFPPGNVLNWNELEFQIIGRVLIEDKQKVETCY
ncbi:serum amyloid P-component-like isoform X1 [Trematomus bernacchii]|uniref:serum amyloid P-component-like isoform X1 n=2 Tax=Trematomus bernacchii TaxID=40690 RepID=UPI00146C7E02|nr:serum amyloid P-component-like isoform X1 [Trematomus bernacchii]